MNLRRVLVLAAVLATGTAGDGWAASAAGASGLVVFLKMAMAVLCLLLLLSLPWLLLLFIEHKSGDPLWLYHKVFRDWDA